MDEPDESTSATSPSAGPEAAVGDGTPDVKAPDGHQRGPWRTTGRWALRLVAVVIVLVLVAAIVPVSSSGLDAQPSPTGTYGPNGS